MPSVTSESRHAAPRSPAIPTAASDANAEIARLKQERDAATEALAQQARRADRGGSALRRGVAGLMVVLFVILLPITATAAWAHRSVLDTGTYIKTVGPIAADPAVTAAISRRVTDQLYTALDPQTIVAGALPPKAAFLAGPITNGSKSYVEDAVNKVLASPQFQTLWIQANTVAHAQLVSALRGDGNVLSTTNNMVVLNLVPLLNAALHNVQGFAASVVGKPITLPTITTADLPASACQKIGVALNRPVPPTCGQVPLFSAAQLTDARRVVQAFDRAVLALLIIVPLLAVLALVISHRRRRTLLQLMIGGMLALVVIRRGTMWTEHKLISIGRPENESARSSIVHHVLGGFFDLTLWLLVGGLVIALLALVTGPYRWAVAVRAHAADGARSTRDLVSAATTKGSSSMADKPAVLWVRNHLDLLRVGGVVVALLVLLEFSVNFWGFVVIAGLIALYEFWLYRLRPPSSVTLPPDAPPRPTG
jgi:hypothetical protein